MITRASQVPLVVKNSPANAGDARDMGSVPGLESKDLPQLRILIFYNCFSTT